MAVFIRRRFDNNRLQTRAKRRSVFRRGSPNVCEVPMQFIFEQIRSGGDRNFGYLLGDRESRRAVLIDPSYTPEAFVRRAADQGLTVTHIINTHGHPDHVNGNAVAAELTGAPVAAFKESSLIKVDVGLTEGDELAVGALRLRFFHVPGHCPDHLVVYEPLWRVLITGDLLFVGKVGGTRSDDDTDTEWASLKRLLDRVPEDATVWPGHDYGVRPSSTLHLERATNPFLLCPDLAAFRQLKADWPGVKARLGLK
jgi:glyoxylase-like metal-dependent hydrolase (beta-lactamase superfamily II)